MFKYALMTIFFALAITVQAQNTKIINKDFDIEAYNSIDLDLYGETIFEPWEADYVLVETTVKLWDTPRRVFQDHINKGRYYCHIKGEDEVAKIVSVPVERGKLAARESVVSIVYYPSTFIINGSGMVRQESTLSSKEKK